MEMKKETVQKIAHLARISVDDTQIGPLQKDLSQILTWVEQLGELDTDGVEPMHSINVETMPHRLDVVTEGDQAAAVIQNAPEAEHAMFVVPKVVE